MQLYTILSPCKSIPYYPHANLYPIIPMQIYTLLSPWHDNPPFPSAPYIYYSGTCMYRAGSVQERQNTCTVHVNYLHVVKNVKYLVLILRICCVKSQRTMEPLVTPPASSPSYTGLKQILVT